MDRKNVLALWKKVSTCIADEITNNDEFANRMGLIFEANLVTTDSSDNETADTKPKGVNGANQLKLIRLFCLSEVQIFNDST